MNTLYKITIVFFLVLLNKITISQTSSAYLSQSRLIIHSEDKKGKPFSVHADFAYMIISLSTGDFTLKANLQNINTGDNSLDSLIYIQGSQPFIFKGTVNGNLYLLNELANDEKSHNMRGQLSLNEDSLSCIALYDLVNFAEKSETKNFRMTFKLVVDASKISILGLENKINNQVYFEIIDGTLNTQP
jgi:hypothetical protein